MFNFFKAAATKNEIPKGREAQQMFNRPSVVDVDVVGDGAYVAGEIIGGVYEVFDDTIARNYDGQTVRSMNILDKDNQRKDLTIHFFSEMPTDFEDKANFLTSASAEDLRKRRRTVEVYNAQYKVANSMAYMDVPDINADLDTRLGDKGPIYFIVVAGEAYSATSGLVISPLSWIA